MRTLLWMLPLLCPVGAKLAGMHMPRPLLNRAKQSPDELPHQKHEPTRPRWAPLKKDEAARSAVPWHASRWHAATTAVKGAAKLALPYLGLAGITAGTSVLASSVAGASLGVLIAGSVSLPAVVLLVEFAFFGGGERVAKLMGGHPADGSLTDMVHEVAQKAGVPPPAHVYEIPVREPNAFAAGIRKRDVTVAVTSGLRTALTTTELKAVLAHEMGHVRARDVNSNMHMAVVVAGLGGIYEAGRHLLRRKESSTSKKDKEKDNSAALGLALVAGGLLAKVAGEMLRCSSSRRAEYGADQLGAELYGASAMTSALRKIDELSRSQRSDRLRSTRASAFSHAYISNPGMGQGAGSSKHKPWWRRLLGVFNTHPDLDERIDAIHGAMASATERAQ